MVNQSSPRAGALRKRPRATSASIAHSLVYPVSVGINMDFDCGSDSKKSLESMSTHRSSKIGDVESRDERRLVHVFVTFLESNDMLRTDDLSSDPSGSLGSGPGFQERSESPPRLVSVTVQVRSTLRKQRTRDDSKQIKTKTKESTSAT